MIHDLNTSATKKIHNWSGYPVIDSRLYSFRTTGELKNLLPHLPGFIARGSGLSYGDASLAPVILSTLKFNKFLSFDRDNGVLRCESGVSLDEILKVIVPAGWFLPVTPGTKFITLGGAVAADVHGKNHHKEGAFTRYVSELTLMMAGGESIVCSRSRNPALFHATCGGMGLTGVILDIEFRLKKIQTSFIVQRNYIARNFDELIQLLKDHNACTYSVAWIDCLSSGKKLGRAVLMLGEHALPEELPSKWRRNAYSIHSDPRFTARFNMPSFVLNRFSVGLFNSLYFWMNNWLPKNSVVHYDKFFYPLDFVRQWNRLYGKRGFLQYQFVIPFQKGEIMKTILEKISKSKLASFLSVLKLLGPGEHPIAFPLEGFTLALDFPVSKKLFPLLNELDKIVTDNGGRVYLAKDARMQTETFRSGYPQAGKFQQTLKHLNGSLKFESLLSKRLKILDEKKDDWTHETDFEIADSVF